MEQPAEENVTAMICRYAKEQNMEALSQIFQNTSVDCTYGRYPAVYLLAKEGTADSVKAIDLLHKRYGANVNWAIMGAAAAGNYRLIRKFLKEGAMINYAMYGAGQRGDRDLVNWLKARGGDVFWAVAGAAGSSNREFYEEINKEAAAIDKNRAPAGGKFLLGASLADNPTLFNDLIDSGAAGSLLPQIMLAAARVNDSELLNNLTQRPLEQGLAHTADWVILGAFAGHQDGLRKQYMRRSSQAGWAAEGAGYGGHLNLIEYLINKLPDKKQQLLNMAAESAALNGHSTLVTILWSKGASPYPSRYEEGFVVSAAQGGNIQIINETQLALEKEPELRSKIISELKKAGFLNGHEENVLRVASFINDSKLREMFVKEAHKINKELDPKFLFRKSSMLNHFMQQYRLNYNQALAWNSPEIRTLLVQKPEPGKAPRVPFDIIKYVASYVVPLTEFEVNDLYDKLKRAKSVTGVTFKFSEPGKVTEIKESEEAKKPEPPEQEGGHKP